MEKPGQVQNKALVWDCGSSLYDSFELKSFERQLDSAIGRTNSMPHLSEARRAPTQTQTHVLLRKQSSSQPTSPTRRSSKISRSLHKLYRSIFRPKASTASMVYRVEEGARDGLYFGYQDRLSTIPEVQDNSSMDYMRRSSTEFDSKVGRAASERFTASVGISCA